MSKSMVLTLGHNSSAIVVEDGKILSGYEEERFSGIKSDSSFPKQSIGRLIELHGATYDDVCIGHWFTNGIITNNKYIDMSTIEQLSGGHINSISHGLTHHDSHLLSARVFADYYKFPKDCLAIVADGFGTFGECISIYKCDENGHDVITRVFGYGRSLGMLYQYATAYLDMKMHNHEYKMLGYEAHISGVLKGAAFRTMIDIISHDAGKMLKDMMSGDFELDTDPIVNKAALGATQHSIANRLDSVLERLELTDLQMYEKRVIIAFYVQGIVETIMSSLVGLHKPRNLLVSGGLFYNVKLNHVLAGMVDKICVMPLAGDQGAGLGIYEATHGDLQWPGNLAWGHRNLSNIEASEGLITVDDELSAVEIALEEIDENGMINIVRGSMEFGPRSLCNTATIADPSQYIIERINRMNDRTTVMPMAPALTRTQASKFLSESEKVVGSLEYMVITCDVNPSMLSRIQGATHFYPHLGSSTCRPQIVLDDDLFMNTLLEHGPLINTSFNYHGVPIAFEKDSIEYSHKMQNEKDRITTVVISGESK